MHTPWLPDASWLEVDKGLSQLCTQVAWHQGLLCTLCWVPATTWEWSEGKVGGWLAGADLGVKQLMYAHEGPNCCTAS